MSLEYEPASEPLHISVKRMFLNSVDPKTQNGPPKHFRVDVVIKITLSVETPLCPYVISYRRTYGVSIAGLLKKSLRTPSECVVAYLQRYLTESVYSVVLKRSIPDKFVDSSFTSMTIKDKLTNLCGN